jgi:hypothetical protein
MKLSRICALVLLVVVGSAVAFADSIQDPKVIVHGAGNGNSPLGECGRHQCQGVGFNFSMTIPKSGRGYFYFTNTSGKNWTSLALIVSGVSAKDVSCSQTMFLSCSTKTLKNGSVEILLSGVARRADNPRTGIGNGQNFVIGFACAPNCWPAGATVTAHASSAPEPETVALMVTGLGAIFSRRKYWKARFSA